MWKILLFFFLISFLFLLLGFFFFCFVFFSFTFLLSLSSPSAAAFSFWIASLQGAECCFHPGFRAAPHSISLLRCSLKPPSALWWSHPEKSLFTCTDERDTFYFEGAFQQQEQRPSWRLLERFLWPGVTRTVGRVGSPSAVQGRATSFACKRTQREIKLCPRCESGQSVSPGVWQRAKTITGVCLSVPQTKSGLCCLPGVFLGIISTSLKKREKLWHCHNGRQKGKIWFYAAADVS